MTNITKEGRERIKANIRFSKKNGHTKMAVDLALHVILADTINYNKQSEGLDKLKK